MVAHTMARMSEEFVVSHQSGRCVGCGLECWLSGLVPFFLASPATSMESGFIGHSQGSLPSGDWILKNIWGFQFFFQAGILQKQFMSFFSL